LANYLRSYGEDDLAERSLRTTDEELDRIAILGAHYAFSDVAMEHGGSMGGARALSPHSMYWRGATAICTERGPKES
jgi:hypothetical protein